MVVVSAERIVRHAAEQIADGQRVELNGVAAELGLSRATLFRRVGNREQLLGLALAWLSDRSLDLCERRWAEQYGDALHTPEGELRCLKQLEWYGIRAATNTGVRRLLDEEPLLAIRVLTDPFGTVHPGVRQAHARLLRRDAEAGGFTPLLDIDDLAYALVRMAESFFYADVIAGRPARPAEVGRLYRALVLGDAARGPSHES
ncbi:QsdR family transcriptional regulator [Kribbella flavida]|uniref:QsdR family transcriptional regulator n=1 Tax=Kribbella flavida TaxID=182640 RepID=UPI00019BD994|nr:QsdR family transcriptional regulator [Kribbella flavida]